MDAPGIEQLTAEEKRVLELLALGRTSQDIADELAIAPDTVRTHVQNIIAKLGCNLGWRPWPPP